MCFLSSAPFCSARWTILSISSKVSPVVPPFCIEQSFTCPAFSNVPTVSLASIARISDSEGSAIIWSPILTKVVHIGLPSIGNASVPFLSWSTRPSSSSTGSFDVMSAASAASEHASIRLPWSSSTSISTYTIHTFSLGVMQSFLTSMDFDSRIARSTTRATSIASSPGGPLSNSGEASGTNSVPTMRTPSSGVSAKGVPTSILTPASTSVSPRRTLAEPSAEGITLVSTLISLYWSCCRESTRFPPSITSLTNNGSISIILKTSTVHEVALQLLSVLFRKKLFQDFLASYYSPSSSLYLFLRARFCSSYIFSQPFMASFMISLTSLLSVTPSI